MPYKVENNSIVMSEDGLPVFVKEDGSETFVDYEKLMQNLGSANSESKARKQKLNELKDIVNDYENKYGQYDFDTVKKAIDFYNNAESKKLIDKGEKDKAIEDITQRLHNDYKPKIEHYESKIAELLKTLDMKTNSINEQIKKDILANNKYLNELTNMTSDVRYAIFSKYIKVQESTNGDPEIIFYQKNGDPLYSVDNGGHYAGVDEGIKFLWNNYENKDNYLKKQSSGSSSIGNMNIFGSSNISKSEWNTIMQSDDITKRKEYIKLYKDGKIKIS